MTEPTEPTPDLLRLAIRLQHFPSCTSPQVAQITGKRDGAQGLLCRTCHNVWFPPAHLIESTPSSAPDQHDDSDDGWSYRPRELIIPGRPAPRHDGWPTHKARERGRRR